MSICESCKNYKSEFITIKCKNKMAWEQLVNRTIFHEKRTSNYEPEFKQLYGYWATTCAVYEMKSCVYYKKKLFKEITESNNFKHRDIKDVFEIK